MVTIPFYTHTQHIRRFIWILCLICKFIFLSSSNIEAETMTGGSYVLNGSVQVITNQGQGGLYTLQSGVFGRNASNVPNAQENTRTSPSGVFSGSGSQDVHVLHTTSTPIMFVPNSVNQDNKVNPVNSIFSEDNSDQKKYIEFDTGTFGKTSSTVSSITDYKTKNTRNNVTPVIIILGLFFLGTVVWIQSRKNSKII